MSMTSDEKRFLIAKDVLCAILSKEGPEIPLGWDMPEWVNICTEHAIIFADYLLEALHGFKIRDSKIVQDKSSSKHSKSSPSEDEVPTHLTKEDLIHLEHLKAIHLRELERLGLDTSKYREAFLSVDRNFE
jgi:hypothetical protein